MSNRLVVSAAVTVIVNGTKFGQVSSFRWSSATPKKALFGLDQTEAFELAPTTARCSGNIGLYRVVRDGGLEGPGIVAQFQDLTREKYCSLMLVETTSDTVLFRADYCSVTGQEWNVAAKSLMTGSFSFEALTWNNEAAPGK